MVEFNGVFERKAHDHVNVTWGDQHQNNEIPASEAVNVITAEITDAISFIRSTVFEKGDVGGAMRKCNAPPF